MEADEKDQAIAAITALKQKYCNRVDAKDWEGFAALFTGDAPLHPSQSAIAAGLADPVPPRGGPAIADWVRQRVETARTKHEVWPDTLEVEGDSARGVWRMRDHVVWPDRELRGTGFYRESYRRTPDGWRIAETVLDRESAEVSEFGPS